MRYINKLTGCTLIFGCSLMGTLSAAQTKGSLFGADDPWGMPLGGRQTLAYIDKDGKPKEPGLTASEYLPGNGGRAGYQLRHGGVVPGTVRVTVSGRSMRIGVECYVDYANGSLFFAESVKRRDTITVSYQYVNGQDNARSLLSSPGTALKMGATSLNIAAGLTSVGADGLQFNTYGLGMNSRLGKASTLKGMAYFSNPSETNRNVEEGNWFQPTAPVKRADPNAAKSGQLIVQDLDSRLGNNRFRASFQDVGATFNGFQALKAGAGSNAELLGQLNALEKEKGIKRLGFGAGLGLSKSGGLSLDYDRISDGKSDIFRQSLGFTGKDAAITFSTQNIDKGFNRFKDLRDGEAAQWAKEAGISRQNLGLTLGNARRGLLSFSETRFGDETGSFSQKTAGYVGSGFVYNYSQRLSSENFGRLKDLSDAEKTAIALGIRRQYDPDAKPEQVTPKERDQAALEAGVKRTVQSLTTKIGKTGSLSVTDSKVGDSKGSADRRTYLLKAHNVNLKYISQSIARDFAHIGSLNDFEKGQLARENGISRTLLSGDIALTKKSSLSFSDSSLKAEKGGMQRQAIAYKADKIEAKLNLNNTDKGFDRARDLAMTTDPEKAAIESERGFKRRDLWVNFTGIKGLKLDSLDTSLVNRGDELSRSIFRHSIDWVADKRTTVNFLSEGDESTAKGEVSISYRHDNLNIAKSLAGNMRVRFYRDSIERVVGGRPSPDQSTWFLQFETDRKLRNNFFGETKRVEFGDGKYENTNTFDLNLAPTKTVGVKYNRLEIDRGADPSLDTNSIGVSAQVTKQLNVQTNLSETTTNNNNDANAVTVAVTSAISKEIAFTGSYGEVNQKDKNSRQVSDVGITTPKPVNFLGLTNATFTFKYGSLNDQSRLQSEAVSGKLTGMLGKHQLMMEYIGNLDAKRNSSFARTFSFISDRNPKAPLQFDLLYRARNINQNELALVRKYNMALNLTKRFSLTYSYSSLPEDQAGVMQPTRSQVLALRHTLSPRLSFALDYNRLQNLNQKTLVSRMGGVFTGKMDRLAAVQVGYSIDIGTLNGQHTDTHTLRLGYDRKLDADNAIVFSTEYMMNRKDRNDMLTAFVDLRRRF
jgi:hypothetical protein